MTLIVALVNPLIVTLVNPLMVTLVNPLMSCFLARTNHHILNLWVQATILVASVAVRIALLKNYLQLCNYNFVLANTIIFIIY